MTAFATPQDLRSYLDGQTLEDPGDPAIDATGAEAEWVRQATLLLDLVSADIRAAARSSIVQGEESETVTLRGTWSRFLELPGRPVQSVDAVVLNTVPVSSVGFRWNSLGLVRRGAGEFDEPADGVAGGLHWGGPDSSVDVTWSYGFAATPDWVRSMTLRVAARTIVNPAGLSQQSMAGYAESYGRTFDSGGSHLSPAEMRVLRQRFSKTGGSFIARGRS